MKARNLWALGALAVSGCAVCGLQEGSIITIDYSNEPSGACDRTGVLLTLDTGGVAYDYVDLLIGPIAAGEVRVTRITPGAEGGTITVLLDPDLQSREVIFGAQAHEGDATTAFGTTSILVEAGVPVSASLAIVRCSYVGGPFCTDGVLSWCENGADRTATCVEGCNAEQTLCAVPAGGPGPDCGASGASCGMCPVGCNCGGTVPTC
jgi:hypothetical protein